MDKCDTHDFKPGPVEGFTQVGPMVPGTGPIEGVTLFAGRIFAIRNSKVWCLTDDEWVEINIPNKTRKIPTCPRCSSIAIRSVDGRWRCSHPAHASDVIDEALI